MIPDDVNCDLGEGEPKSLSRALMRAATSANIACGGHAGSLQDMEFCVDLALQAGVRIGAHPGIPSRETFGRLPRPIRPQEIAEILVFQCAALEKVVCSAGGRLHHIKLHGALYHAVDKRVADARAAAGAIRKYFPGMVVFAFQGGKFHRESEALGLEVWPEVYADRGYLDSGRLVPRGEPEAVLSGAMAAAERVKHLARFGEILSIRGRPIKVAARTICVHADSPSAAAVAREVRRCLPTTASVLATEPPRHH